MSDLGKTHFSKRIENRKAFELAKLRRALYLALFFTTLGALGVGLDIYVSGADKVMTESPVMSRIMLLGPLFTVGAYLLARHYLLKNFKT